MALASVFGFFYATAWLAGLTGYLPEVTGPVTALTLGVGLGGALLPSGRRNGGCGLGCGLVLVGVLGFGLAASHYPREQQTRVLPREATPVPQWLKGVKPALDGRAPSRPGEVLEGRVLTQGDRVLISVGDTLERAQRVLQPGIEPRRHFRRDGYLIFLPGGSGHVETIQLSREDL